MVCIAIFKKCLIKAFLSDRKHCVLVNGVTLSWHKWQSPGSVLGTILGIFLIFISYIVNVMKYVEPTLFADDSLYRFNLGINDYCAVGAGLESYDINPPL